MAKNDKEAKSIQMSLIDEPGVVDRLELDPDSVRELAANIKENGLLQPIVVAFNKGRYEIVAGHRRFTACSLLGWSTIQCIIFVGTEAEIAFARASENLARVDLTLIEEARIYKNLHDKHGLTYNQIGTKMGISKGLVKRRMDLLTMPEILQKAIHKNLIGYGVAEELWRMKDEEAIDYYLGFCIDHGATKEIAKQWAKEYLDSKRRKDSPLDPGDNLQNPMVDTPVYVACDVCRNPMEIGTEQLIRACPVCTQIIREYMTEIDKQRREGK